MGIETKPSTDRDYQQTLKKSYNDVNATLGVDGFIVGQVGNKIIIDSSNSIFDTFSFYESTTLLYVIQVTYTDNTKTTTSQVERTS